MATKSQLGTPGFKNSVSTLGMDVGIDSLWHTPLFPQILEEIQFYLRIKNYGLQSSFVQIYKDQIFQSSFDLNEQNDTAIQIIGDGFESGINETNFFIHSPGDKNQTNNSMSDSIFVSYPEKSILINEIMYDPLTGDQEWVEIINNSEFEINLYNWKILDNLEDEIKGVEANILLNPGAYIVLGEDDISGILFQDDFPGLNNSGDNLFLLDPVNKIIDNVIYVDDWGSGDGFSLERITFIYGFK